MNYKHLLSCSTIVALIGVLVTLFLLGLGLGEVSKLLF